MEREDGVETFASDALSHNFTHPTFYALPRASSRPTYRYACMRSHRDYYQISTVSIPTKVKVTHGLRMRRDFVKLLERQAQRQIAPNRTRLALANGNVVV